MRFPDGRAMVLFPVAVPSEKQEPAFIQSLLTRGFTRLKVGDELMDLHEAQPVSIHKQAACYVVLDRLGDREQTTGRRLAEAIETAFREGDGRCAVEVIGHGLQSYSAKLSLPAMRTHI